MCIGSCLFQSNSFASSFSFQHSPSYLLHFFSWLLSSLNRVKDGIESEIKKAAFIKSIFKFVSVIKELFRKMGVSYVWFDLLAIHIQLCIPGGCKKERRVGLDRKGRMRMKTHFKKHAFLFRSYLFLTKYHFSIPVENFVLLQQIQSYNKTFDIKT